MRARCLIALAVALAGCSGPEQRPAGTPTDDSFLTGRDDGADDRPASASVAGGVDPTRVGNGPLSSHWDALMARQLATAEGNTYRMKEFHRGEHLSLTVVGVAGELPPPRRPQTEVLLVVEGSRGMVEMAGKRYRLSAGSVAVFPPGTRGSLLAPKQEPLIGLLIGVDLPCPAGTQAYLTSFDTLWSEKAFHTNRDHSARLLTIPGVLSLDAETIYGFIPPQHHTRHEELVFFLQGEGSFGLGSTGNLVRDGSLLLAPPSTPHFFQNRKQQGSRCLVLHAPDLGAHDTTLIEGHPEHEVPEELNYPGYQREDAPGDGAPGGR